MMTEDERELLAHDISKEIVEQLWKQLWDHPQIIGIHGVVIRGTSSLENEIYSFLMDHATFLSDKAEHDLPSIEVVRGILKPDTENS